MREEHNKMHQLNNHGDAQIPGKLSPRKIIEEAVERGRQHPLNIQNYDTKKADRHSLNVMTANAILDTLIASGMKKGEAMKQLSKQEVMALEEEKFIEAKMRQTGRQYDKKQKLENLID